MLNDKIEYNQDTLQQQLTEYREELKQTVMEMEEKIEKTSEVVFQVREEILIKVNEVEGEGKRRVGGLQKETNNKLEQIQIRVDENYSKLDGSVNQVKDTTTAVSYTHLG